MQQDSCDVAAIREMKWDEGYKWSAAIHGYKHFRRDKQGWRGDGVALYIRESLNYIGLKVEYLWVRIRGKANEADILMGVYYRQPNQDEGMDELFCKYLADVSQLLALVLLRD